MVKDDQSKKSTAARKRKRPKKEPDANSEKLEVEREQYVEQMAEWEDKFLRLAADFDNLKKRSAREFGDLIKNANEELLSQLIPVVDNFERALEAATSSDDFSSFHKGVEMIYRQMRDLLERQGVKAIDALHEPFDPTFHEAVMVREEEDQPSETVVEEVEKGYLLYDRILRPSKVVVSK